MLYSFNGYTLDTYKVELRHGEMGVALEPRVFALLALLLENRDRLVTRDEIIEKVWDGRIVSESAVSSCIKSVRRAVGDDGATQKVIRTVHGRGFRCIADVKLSGAARPGIATLPGDADYDATTPTATALLDDSRPSIAVLPFRLLGHSTTHGAIAEAIPHELITALCRLRWLFVIARGSTFRFRSPEPDVVEIGRMLGARYCLSGVVEIFGKAITIAVELSDTRDGGVVWGERFSASIDDVHTIRADIISNIVSALEIQIPINEARVARLSVPENLDAWAAYHLGLRHMYRFNKHDNAIATSLFDQAVKQDPGFARAHAGLSFTHFQNAFLRNVSDPDREAELARACAERSLELDPLDPFANFTMGRTFWLDGDLDSSLSWLDRSVSLSPNYAHGMYARAWTDTISGRGSQGRTSADTAMSLSPLDPFLYAMQSITGLSFLVEGKTEEAAIWADRGARAPGAHFLIAAIAALAYSMAGDDERAAAWVAQTKARRPDCSQAHFFQAFPFADERLKREFTAALARHGIN